MRVIVGFVIGLVMASGIASTTVVQAAPQMPSRERTGSVIRHVEHRHHSSSHRSARRHRSGIGPVEIIGGIIVGAIIAEVIREGRATEYAMSRCALGFRSFDPDTGTYITRDGRIRICPCLR
ncbi:MAG: BA14K family protein [Hyphomicrobiaceae bacterium]